MHSRQRVAESTPAQHTSSAPDLVLDPDALYPLEVNLNGTTKHSRYCKALFARRDFQCARCLEMLHGSAPRGSWQEGFAARKLRQIQGRFLW